MGSRYFAGLTRGSQVRFFNRRGKIRRKVSPVPAVDCCFLGEKSCVKGSRWVPEGWKEETFGLRWYRQSFLDWKMEGEREGKR
jgi:hypothetical protein